MNKLLEVSEGDRKRREVALDAPEIHIGRDPHCELTLEDALASRKHAVITSTETGIRIQDLQSRNGTRVNGTAVTTCDLEHGDVIKIGNTRITFKLKDREISTRDFTSNASAGLENIQTIAINTQDLFVSGETSRGLESPARATAALKTLYEAGQIINSVLDTEELLNRVIELVFQSLEGVDHCFIFLINDETGELEYKTGRSLRGEEDELLHHFSTSIVEPVINKKQALLTYDALSDDRFDAGQSLVELNIRSAICAPLQTRDKIWGIIQANTLDPSQKLTEEDLRLLASIGLQAGSALQNAQLYESLNEEKQALHKVHEALKQTQVKLVQNERMAAIGALAAGVVHDIKTPLAVIQGYYKLIQKEFDTKEDADINLGKLKQCAAGIAEGLDRSTDVVKSLLDFAKPEEGMHEDLAINALLEETLVFLKSQLSGRSTRIVRHLESELPKVRCDGNQIKRVLVNIIMNALQAMGDRGELTLSSYRTTLEDRLYVVLGIKDNGPGMPDEVKRHIFEPFFSTKTPDTGIDGGTGLGLSVCYNIIQSHAGNIEVESGQGAGTAFTLYLPASAPGSVKPGNQTVPINLED